MRLRRFVRVVRARLGRLLSGEDPVMRKHTRQPRYHYSKGMEPGSWNEQQQISGRERYLRREVSRRKVASAPLRRPTNLRRIA